MSVDSRTVPVATGADVKIIPERAAVLDERSPVRARRWRFCDSLVQGLAGQRSDPVARGPRSTLGRCAIHSAVGRSIDRPVLSGTGFAYSWNQLDVGFKQAPCREAGAIGPRTGLGAGAPCTTWCGRSRACGRPPGPSRNAAPRQRHQKPGVAVGTEVTLRPPHRSVRAELPHTAPASGHDAKRTVG